MSPPMVEMQGQVPPQNSTDCGRRAIAERGGGCAGLSSGCGRRQYESRLCGFFRRLLGGLFRSPICGKPGLAICVNWPATWSAKAIFLRRKPIIDLAYLVDHVIRKRVPLSVEALQKAPTRFFIVLTELSHG